MRRTDGTSAVGDCPSVVGVDDRDESGGAGDVQTLVLARERRVFDVLLGQVVHAARLVADERVERAHRG